MVFCAEFLNGWWSWEPLRTIRTEEEEEDNDDDDDDDLLASQEETTHWNQLIGQIAR